MNQQSLKELVTKKDIKNFDDATGLTVEEVNNILNTEEMEVNESLYLKQLIEMEEPQKAAMTFLDRLIQEQTELEDKIVKLGAFLTNEEKAKSISGELQYNYLGIQLPIMISYNKVLKLRIKDLTK